MTHGGRLEPLLASDPVALLDVEPLPDADGLLVVALLPDEDPRLDPDSPPLPELDPAPTPPSDAT